MASGKNLDTLWIAVLVGVAVVLAVLAFQKDSGKKPPVLPEPAAAATPVGTIKPLHPEGGAAISAGTLTPAVVEPPRRIAPKNTLAIQIHSFRQKERADVVLEQLKTKGYANAYVMVSDLGERGTWHRVRVGPFDDENEARNVLETLRNDFHSGILVSE